MRSKKGFFGINLILAAVALILMAVTAGLATHAGYDDVQDGFYYSINRDNSVDIVFCDVGGDVAIPSHLDGRPVYSISSTSGNIFRDASTVTSLTLPSTLEWIGTETFKGCTSLTAVTISGSETSVGYGAFSGCSALESLTTPLNEHPLGYIFGGEEYAGAVRIWQWNHSERDDISSYYIPSTLRHVTVIGDEITSGALDECNTIETVVVADSVTSIGDYAFYGCSNLTSVTIPDGVTSIGDHAFHSCAGLTSITIPDSVTSIGSDAFSGCSGLTAIHYTGDLEDWCGISGLGNIMSSGRTLYIGGGKVEGDIIIPDGVTSIESYAFYGCSDLTSVTIPNSVTYIGWNAFRDCTGLTSITIPDSVTSIGDNAFHSCAGLTSITIPDSVTSIGGDAFYNCGSLEAVHITDIGKWAAIDFGNSDANPLDYAGNLYLNGELVTDLVIPGGVTSIGDYAFYGCSGLTSVTIPGGVTSVGDRAFCGCDSLTSITIPDSVTSIGDSAFNSCDSLTSVTIGNGVTSIGDSAFAYCDSLTSVTIGNGVTSIGKDPFSYCNKLSFIIFDGAKFMWDAIRIEDIWDWDIQYVQCSDGRVYV